MQRDQLRPCTVRINEVTEEYRALPDMEKKTRVIREAETHKGYFHTWGAEAYTTNGYLVGTVAGQVSTLYGLVEYEDGTMHKVDPECIRFSEGDYERKQLDTCIDICLECDGFQTEEHGCCNCQNMAEVMNLVQKIRNEGGLT